MPPFSMFPKLLAHLKVDGLAETVRRVGLDTVNVVVRDGFWVTPGGLADELPRFLAALRRHGIVPTFATACFDIDAILADDRMVAILAEHGLRQFRTGYLQAGTDPRAAMVAARTRFERLAAMGERRGIQAVYQLHHGTLLPTASLAATLVAGLDPRWIGIEPDAGNQTFEGFEDWDRCLRLLGSHCTAFAVKDTAPYQERSRAAEPGKGWRRRWVSCREGVTDFQAAFRALQTIGFHGPIVLQPFYHEQDPAAFQATLTDEVAYLRQAWTQASIRPEVR